MRKINKIQKIIERILQAVRRDESYKDFSRLDSKMAARLSDLGYRDLSRSLASKANRQKPRPQRKTKFGLLKFAGISFATTFATVVLVLGGAYLLGYLDFLKGSDTPGSLTELAQLPPVPIMTMKPAKYTDSGYADIDNSFTIQLDSPIRANAEKAIKVEPKVDFEVKTQTDKNGQTIEIIPKTDLAEGEVYQFTLAKGVKFENGSELQKDLSWSFKTEPDFAILGTTPRDGAKNVPVNTTIEFEFNHKNIDSRKLGDYFEIVPDISGRFEKHGMKVVFIPDENLESNTSYHVQVDAGYTNENGEKLANEVSFKFETGQDLASGGDTTHKSLIFRTQSQVANVTDRLALSACMLGFGSEDPGVGIDFTLYEIDIDTAVSELKHGNGRIDRIPTGAKMLDSQSFSQLDNSCNTYIYEPGPGIYILKASSDVAEQPQYLMRTVSDIGLIMMNEREASKGWVVEMFSETGFSGASVAGHYFDNDNASSVKSKSQGFFEIDNGSPADFIVAQIDDQFALSGRNFSDIGLDGFYDSGLVGDSNEYTSYVYTDKPIYKPGDTVNFKVINRSWIGDGIEELKDRKIFVEALSQSSQFEKIQSRSIPIFEKEYFITDYGTFYGSFMIPLTYQGNFTEFRVYVGNELAGREYIEISEFIKPKKQYTVNTPKENYFEGESVELEIVGTDYMGFPLSNQELTLEIEREELFEEGNLSIWKNSYKGYTCCSEFIQKDTIRLNENGRATYNFVPDSNNSGPNMFTYIVRVLEDDGLTGSYDSEKSIFVSKSEKNIVISTEGKNSRYTVGQDAMVVFTAESLWSGDFIEGQSFVVDITRKWSDKVFDGTEYNPDTKSHYDSYQFIEKEERIVENKKLTVDKDGKIKFEIQNLQKGRYDVTVRFDGISKTKESVFNVYEFEIDDDNPLQIFVKESEVTAGEEVDVEIITSESSNGWLTLNGEILHEWNYFENASPDDPAQYSFTSTDTMYPHVQVCAYAIVNGVSEGLDTTADLNTGKGIVSKCERIYVNSDKRVISLDIKSDKEIYKPGEEVVLDVKTFNSAGLPVKTELSFNVVDQSLLDYVRKSDIADDEISDIFHRARVRGTDSYISNLGKFPLSGGMGSRGGVKLRSEFRDIALWLPDVETDLNGRARVKFELPDNLTTWNLGIIAADKKDDFGAGHIRFVSRLDESVSMDKPLFLRRGDKLTSHFEIANYSESDFDGKFEVDWTGNLNTWSEGVLVKKNSRVGLKPEIAIQENIDNLVVSASLIDVHGNNTKLADGIEHEIPIYSNGYTKHDIKTTILDQGQEKVNLDIDLGENFDRKVNFINLSLGKMFSIEEMTKAMPVYSDSTINLANIILHNTYIYDNYDLLNPGIEKSVLKKRVSDAYGLLMRNQAGDGGFGWFSYDAVSLEASVLAAESMESIETSGIIDVNHAYKSNLSSYLEGIIVGESYSIFDKVIAYKGISHVDSDKAYIYMSQFTELAHENSQLQSSPLSVAYLMQAFNNIDAEGNSISLSRYLRATAKTSERGSYWEDSESDYKLSQSSDYVTAMVYQAISPIELWEFKEKARNWLLDRKSSSYGNDEHYERIIYALAVAEAENLYGLNTTGRFDVIANGKKVNSLKLEKNKNTVSLDIYSEYLTSGVNSIQIIRKDTARKGDIYVLANSLVISENSTTNLNGSNSDSFQVSKKIYDLDSAKEVKASDIHVGDLLRIRLEVTANGDYSNVKIYDQLPAGWKVAELSYYDTSRYVNEKSWEGFDDNSWVNRYPDLVADRVSFSSLSMEAGESYSYEYIVSAVRPGEFNFGNTYVGLELFPDVSSIYPGGVCVIGE